MHNKYLDCLLGCIKLSGTHIYFFLTLLLFQYEDCIKDCDKAVERGRELRSDFKMIAKALTRKGSALVKMAKTSKDYEPAIESFQKALTEHRNPDTLKKLNDAEKAKKELEQQEYFDPKVADEEREKGIPSRTLHRLFYLFYTSCCALYLLIYLSVLLLQMVSSCFMFVSFD